MRNGQMYLTNGQQIGIMKIRGNLFQRGCHS
nr:MAG TPA: hypothetical protein [Caudoviricetes sp.]